MPKTDSLPKPKVKLVGQDGNVFNLIGLAYDTLQVADQRENAKIMRSECFSAGSYDEVLGIISNYCDIR